MGFDSNIRGSGRGVSHGVTQHPSQEGKPAHKTTTHEKERTQSRQGQTHTVNRGTGHNSATGKTENSRNQTINRSRPGADTSASAVLFKRGGEDQAITVGNSKGKDVYTHTSRNGTNLTANVAGPYLKVEGGAKVEVSKDGLTADVSLKVDANAVKAGTEATRTFTIKHGNDRIDVKVKLGAETKVGADGELKLKVNLNPVHPSVNAAASGFVGAKGTLSGNIDVSVNNKAVVGSELKVTLGAGAGAEAAFEGSLTHFKAKAYAAVGAGVGVELEGKAYAGNLVRSAWELSH